MPNTTTTFDWDSFLNDAQLQLQQLNSIDNIYKLKLQELINEILHDELDY